MKILFVLLSIVDLCLTIHLIDLYGADCEANPVAMDVYKSSGYLGLFLLKFLSVLTALLIFRVLEKRSPKVALVLKLLACIANGIAVSIGLYLYAI